MVEVPRVKRAWILQVPPPVGAHTCSSLFHHSHVSIYDAEDGELNG